MDPEYSIAFFGWLVEQEENRTSLHHITAVGHTQNTFGSPIKPRVTDNYLRDRPSTSPSTASMSEWCMNEEKNELLQYNSMNSPISGIDPGRPRGLAIPVEHQADVDDCYGRNLPGAQLSATLRPQTVRNRSDSYLDTATVPDQCSVGGQPSSFGPSQKSRDLSRRNHINRQHRGQAMKNLRNWDPVSSPTKLSFSEAFDLARKRALESDACDSSKSSNNVKQKRLRVKH
ncbi:hypothetical protein OPT61_g8646 [Boeremia exigua]|uniref:Uncharacterized protein n=1 Tax=Boeremia exigua TaxID=749465 RepID=A0ACC2HY83_9PLEO|nr:hypothetical protein OPT61_g8646 [Boeremia exigua]